MCVPLREFQPTVSQRAVRLGRLYPANFRTHFALIPILVLRSRGLFAVFTPRGRFIRLWVMSTSRDIEFRWGQFIVVCVTVRKRLLDSSLPCGWC